MTVDLKHLTYQPYLALPEMKARYSIVNGVRVMDAVPTPAHQLLLQELLLKLVPCIREHRLGELFIAPLDIVIHRDPLRTRQPDLMFISHRRRSIVGQQVITGGPDLVIDILSPSNTRRELEAKLQDYQSVNVREAWVVGTQGQTVEVLQLCPERIERVGLYGFGDTIASQVLPDLHLTMAEIFPEF
jgi:Uma2 family endonuclease